MPEVIYEKTFCPDSEGSEARAVIVDYSDSRHVEFRYGITERGLSPGSREVVTSQEKLEEDCAGVPGPVRKSLWQGLFRRAKEELDREIRIATDPHYDMPEIEIY